MTQQATESGDLFTSTAGYYARFRPRYPDALLDLVTGADRSGRALDLGCGTGELAVPLARRYSEVWAVDIAGEMIEQGQARARRDGAAGIRWLRADAALLQAPAAHFDVITIGAAFHWMDRRAVGASAMRWLRPGGLLAVAGVNSTWNGDEEWQRLALEVIRRWLGDERRAGSGTFTQRTGPKERHEDAMRAVGFEHVTSTEFPTPHTWTVDEFIGYLYSTSFASSAVLGERKAGFEADLRRVLQARESSGVLTECLRFHCLTGRSPEL